MPVSPEDFSCAVCTKRFETGNAAAPLQCRALPPVQGLPRDAIFPTVAESHHCHAYFEADAGAIKARKAARATLEDLDAKVVATQAQEAAADSPDDADAPAAKPRARRARAGADNAKLPR